MINHWFYIHWDIYQIVPTKITSYINWVTTTRITIYHIPTIILTNFSNNASSGRCHFRRLIEQQLDGRLSFSKVTRCRREPFESAFLLCRHVSCHYHVTLIYIAYCELAYIIRLQTAHKVLNRERTITIARQSWVVKKTVATSCLAISRAGLCIIDLGARMKHPHR